MGLPSYLNVTRKNIHHIICHLYEHMFMNLLPPFFWFNFYICITNHTESLQKKEKKLQSHHSHFMTFYVWIKIDQKIWVLTFFEDLKKVEHQNTNVSVNVFNISDSSNKINVELHHGWILFF